MLILNRDTNISIIDNYTYDFVNLFYEEANYGFSAGDKVILISDKVTQETFVAYTWQVLKKINT